MPVAAEPTFRGAGEDGQGRVISLPSPGAPTAPEARAPQRRMAAGEMNSETYRLIPEVPRHERLALTVEEAGALLGISRDLAYDLVNRGELPSLRLGRRLIVPRRALERLVDQASTSTDP